LVAETIAGLSMCRHHPSRRDDNGAANGVAAKRIPYGRAIGTTIVPVFVRAGKAAYRETDGCVRGFPGLSKRNCDQRLTAVADA
jgi:hypothetical protein